MAEPIDNFDLCMLKNVRKAARAVSRRYDVFVRHLGLKAAQFTTLILVRNHPGKTTSDLADMAVLERTTLVRNLAVLQKQGLITSKTADRKKGQSGGGTVGKAHSLTPKGEALLEEALPLWRKAQADLADEIGEDTFVETIKALQVLARV